MQEALHVLLTCQIRERERMKGSQELPISLTTKTYDKALMSVSGRSWECAKESTSESRHVPNLGVCETGEGRGQVGVSGGDPMAKAWGRGSDGSFLGSSGSGGVLCPLRCPCRRENKLSLGRDGWVLQCWGLGCSAVVAWVIETARTRCLQPLLRPAVAPSDPLSSCRAAVAPLSPPSRW